MESAVRTRRRISNVGRAAGSSSPWFRVWLTICLSLVTACHHSPTSPNTPTPTWCEGTSLGTMTATIDERTVWTAVRVVANDLGGSLNSIEVTGSDCSYRLWISIQPVHGPGTYSVDNDSVVATFNTDAGPNEWTANQRQGGSGSVTLTALKASGYMAIGAAGSFELRLVKLGANETMTIRGSFETHSP